VTTVTAESAPRVRQVFRARADPPRAAAWQLPNVLWWYLDLRKHSADWITATRRGLAAARRLGDTDAESRCWNVLGSAYGSTMPWCGYGRPWTFAVRSGTGTARAAR
jgi:hypothetical protein